MPSARTHQKKAENPDPSTLEAALAKDAPARKLTAGKTASILLRDQSRVTGFVVSSPAGGVGIIDKSAVRWLTAEEMWWLMHDSAQTPQGLKPPGDIAENLIKACLPPDGAYKKEQVAQTIRDYLSKGRRSEESEKLPFRHLPARPEANPSGCPQKKNMKTSEVH